MFRKRFSAWLARRRVRQVAGLLLLVLSVFYLLRSIDDGLAGLYESARSLTFLEGSLLVLGVLGTLALSTAYHILTLLRLQRHGIPPTRVGAAYAIGQIVRYIPGKIVGVVFQISYLGGRIRATNVVLSLLVQTLYDYAWTFVFAGIVLWCWHKGSLLPALAFLPISILLLWAHSHGICERIIRALPLLNRIVPDRIDVGGHMPLAGPITAILVTEWLPMLLGIALAFRSAHGFNDGLALAALYLLAAMLSLAVVVVPSGLGVREAIFVWLGAASGFPPALLLFVAVVIRLAMTIAEALNAACFAVADCLERRRLHTTIAN